MLSEGDFYLPRDMDVLRMENELLALENSLLRGSGSVSSEATKEAITQARREEREKGREAVHRLREKFEADTAERRARYASVPHGRLERLQKADSDIRWFVGRLNGSAVGPLLRRWDGFKVLVSRYSS